MNSRVPVLFTLLQSLEPALRHGRQSDPQRATGAEEEYLEGNVFVMRNMASPCRESDAERRLQILGDEEVF